MTDFFKHGNKVYSENLNDGILVGNSFDWTVNMSLPGDTGGVFPNSTTVVKAKVADVYATPNSNLSIGETITNNAGSSRVYRLTVYPNFNRFGGFTFVSLEGDGSVIITEKGGTSPVRNNLDYSNLGDVVELKQLKEYDIVITIPASGVVTGLSFGFQSSTASAEASISQANVTGLESSLTALEEGITTVSDNLESLLNSEATARSNADNVLHTLLESLVEQNDLTFTQIASVTGTLTNNNNSLEGTFVVKLNYRLSGEVPSLVATNPLGEYELDIIRREGATGFVFDFDLDNLGCPYTLTASVGEETRVGTITSVGIGESKTFTF